jgi:acyl carrier protein
LQSARPVAAVAELGSLGRSARMGWFSDSEEKQERLEHVFGGRQPLDDSQLWENFFKREGVALDTVTRVRRILSEILEADLLRIHDTDDFSKELAFFWDLDSLVDVEIVQALEQEFHITITDAEAVAMKTLRDIVLGVHAKLTTQTA